MNAIPVGLEFPLFALARRATHFDLLTVERDGREFLPIYRAREVAELYVEQACELNVRVTLLADAWRNSHALESQAAGVDIVWDRLEGSNAFRSQSMVEALRSLASAESQPAIAAGSEPA